jgi:hypothetical protein
VSVQDVDRPSYRTALGLSELEDRQADDGRRWIVNLANDRHALVIAQLDCTIIQFGKTRTSPSTFVMLRPRT